MLLETELLKQTNNKNKTKQNPKNKNKKINQNCIKSGLSQFLFNNNNNNNNNNSNNNNNNNSLFQVFGRWSAARSERREQVIIIKKYLKASDAKPRQSL